MGQDWSEVWLQKFSGTVTIWPKSIPSDFYYILSDPTPERLERMLHEGQRSTFGKIQFIKNRAKIETEIMNGLIRCSPARARNRIPSPILSRRDVGRVPGTDEAAGRSNDHEQHVPGDSMVERLDHAFPERFSSNYKDVSRYMEVPDSVSTNSSRALGPYSASGGFVKELRRQSSVFFDDAHADADADTDGDGEGDKADDLN